MEQPTFADLVYDAKKRQTRREIFLERMDGLIPWQKLEEAAAIGVALLMSMASASGNETTILKIPTAEGQPRGAF